MKPRRDELEEAVDDRVQQQAAGHHDQVVELPPVPPAHVPLAPGVEHAGEEDDPQKPVQVDETQQRLAGDVRLEVVEVDPAGAAGRGHLDPLLGDDLGLVGVLGIGPIHLEVLASPCQRHVG